MMEKTPAIPLILSPNLERLVSHWKDGIRPNEEDLKYLINSAARYESLERFSRSRDVGQIDLRQAVSAIAPLRASDIHGGIYDFRLNCFWPSSHNVETMSVQKIRQTVNDALIYIIHSQETFDESGKEIKVVGRFNQLDIHYGWKILVESDSSVDDVVSLIVARVIEKVQNDCVQKQQTLDRLLKPHA